MVLKTISKWHKITAEKDGNFYIVFDSVKSVFGGGWDNQELKRGLSLSQIKELKQFLDLTK